MNEKDFKIVYSPALISMGYKYQLDLINIKTEELWTIYTKTWKEAELELNKMLLKGWKLNE